MLLIILLDALLLLLTASVNDGKTCFFFFFYRHLLDVGFNNHAIRMISQTRIQKKPEVISRFCCVFLVLLQ